MNAEFQQLRVLDSPQQLEATVNAISEEDRPQHRDYYPALFNICVRSFKSSLED